MENLPKTTTRKLVKKNILNAVKAMDDNLIYIIIPENSREVYIKDTKNTMIIQSK